MKNILYSILGLIMLACINIAYIIVEIFNSFKKKKIKNKNGLFIYNSQFNIN